MYTARDCFNTLANVHSSGAQIVFRSLIQPVFARYFSTAGSTAADLRSKVDEASRKSM
jgi:receptor expression-enhancing protein 5/6